MARKIMSGLYQRNGIWHIDKVVRGSRRRGSTGASEREEAEEYLIHRLEKLRQEKIYGVRQVRTWREAATWFLIEFKDQASQHLIEAANKVSATDSRGPALTILRKK